MTYHRIVTILSRPVPLPELYPSGFTPVLSVIRVVRNVQ